MPDAVLQKRNSPFVTQFLSSAEETDVSVLSSVRYLGYVEGQLVGHFSGFFFFPTSTNTVPGQIRWCGCQTSVMFFVMSALICGKPHL